MNLGDTKQIRQQLYKKVLAMNANKRVQLLQRPNSEHWLSTLTPIQLAQLFPDYYKKSKPDVGMTLATSGGVRMAGLPPSMTGGAAPSAAPLASRERGSQQKSPWGRRGGGESSASTLSPEDKLRMELEKDTGIGQPIPQNRAEAAVAVSKINPNQLAFIKGIGQTESDFSEKEAYSDQYNQPGNNRWVREKGDAGKDYGYFQNNKMDVDEAIRLGVKEEIAKHLNGGGKETPSSLEEQIVAMHEYLSKRYPDVYNDLKSGDAKAFERAREKLDGKWFGLRDRPDVARKEFAKAGESAEGIFPQIRFAAAKKELEDIAAAARAKEELQPSDGSIIPKKNLLPESAQKPEGLEPRLSDLWDKSTTEQREALSKQIVKLGGAESANEWVKKRFGSGETGPLNFKEGSTVIETQADTGAQRSGKIQEDLKDRIDYALRKVETQLPEGTKLRAEVYSGGQNMPGMKGGWASRPKGASPEHNSGGAADLYFVMTDKNGKERKLSMADKDDAKIMNDIIRAGGEAGIRSVGAWSPSRRYMGPENVHLGISRNNPKAYFGTQETREAWSEGYNSEARKNFNLEDYRKQRQQELDNQAATAREKPDLQPSDGSITPSKTVTPEQPPVPIKDRGIVTQSGHKEPSGEASPAPSQSPVQKPKEFEVPPIEVPQTHPRAEPSKLGGPKTPQRNDVAPSNPVTNDHKPNTPSADKAYKRSTSISDPSQSQAASA